MKGTGQKLLTHTSKRDRLGILLEGATIGRQHSALLKKDCNCSKRIQIDKEIDQLMDNDS